MFRTSRRTVPVLVGLLTLGLVIPSIAQRQSEGKDTKGTQYKAESKTPDLNEAKEMAKLIEQGQARLSDATEMAETHVKGTALGATCEIRSGGTDDLRLDSHNPNMPGAESDVNRPGPNDPQDPNQPPDPIQEQDPNLRGQADQKPMQDRNMGQDQGKRLVYEVCCFADDKIHKVRIDGKTKKVIDAKEDKVASRDTRRIQQP